VLSFPFNKSATSSTFRGLKNKEEKEEGKNCNPLTTALLAERRAVGKRGGRIC
jgi:hypothetical protein